jgi:septal ring factor EnvC (AmiA/AmiB activator)
VVGRGDEQRPGLIIQAPPGAPVRAPWEGTVVHAAPLAGYGLVLVLDHGARVHTVLAHLGGLRAEAGQRVAAGQVVGQVDPGGRLYLEVRKAAKPENPMEWLRLDP